MILHAKEKLLQNPESLNVTFSQQPVIMLKDVFAVYARSRLNDKIYSEVLTSVSIYRRKF